MTIAIYLLIFISLALMILAFARPQSREDAAARLQYMREKEQKGEPQEKTTQKQSRREALERLTLESQTKLAPVAARYLLPNVTLFLRKKLDDAGDYEIPVERYAANSLIGLLLFPALFLLINWSLLGYEGLTVFLAMALLMVLGVYFPIVRLNTRIERRKRDIFRNFPNFLDLLTICLEAGMGLDAALNLLTHKIQPSPLRQELEKTLAEIKVGKPRIQALKDMATRINMKEIASFVVALSQVEQMGGSLAQTLKVQSEIAREARWQKAQEMAQKAPVKMLFPMLLLIFPNIFLMIFGPLLLSYILGKL